MKLEFPDGYHVEPMKERKCIAINGQSFTAREFDELLHCLNHEDIYSAARRLATALGVGLVITNRPE